MDDTAAHHEPAPDSSSSAEVLPNCLNIRRLAGQARTAPDQSPRDHLVSAPDGPARIAVSFVLLRGMVYVARLLYERGPRGPLFTVFGLVTQPGAGVPVPTVVADPRTALVDVR